MFEAPERFFHINYMHTAEEAAVADCCHKWSTRSDLRPKSVSPSAQPPSHPATHPSIHLYICPSVPLSIWVSLVCCYIHWHVKWTDIKMTKTQINSKQQTAAARTFRLRQSLLKRWMGLWLILLYFLRSFSFRLFFCSFGCLGRQ